MNNLTKVSLFVLISVLAGCASPKKFDKLTNKTWKSNEAPYLSDVIKKPVDSIVDVYKRNETPVKGKFESQQDYEKRVAGLVTSKNAFIVIPLNTQSRSECATSYDFAKQTYKIDCIGFDSGNTLSDDSKIEKTITLANAFTSREVNIIEANEYYLAANFPIQFELNLSPEEAKGIDDDLMGGLSFTVRDVNLFLSGCAEYEVVGALSDKYCSESAFKTGSAVELWKRFVYPEDISDLVVFRKSNNRVLVHQKYGAVHQ